MIKLKYCGLSREEDIETVNRLKPDFIGFVFAEKSKRYITKEQAIRLKQLLLPKIKAVGVFVNEDVKKVAEYLKEDIIDIAQLHGDEDETYIQHLRSLSEKHIIKAFKIKKKDDLIPVRLSSADYIMLDSGAGSGDAFDWDLVKSVERPYFLAGGLSVKNVEIAIRNLNPYGLDVSSGIETDGVKDPVKMETFMELARKTEAKINI